MEVLHYLARSLTSVNFSENVDVKRGMSVKSLSEAEFYLDTLTTVYIRS